MENIQLEIGKNYKTREGKIVLVYNGAPPINGERIGWNGIYFGKFVDGSSDVVERFLFNGKHWNYVSQFSSFGGGEFNIPEKDIIEEIK